ncbi:MAG: hypothetical protein ACRDY7_06770 [Acidimicrobiia bacterium]
MMRGSQRPGRWALLAIGAVVGAAVWVPPAGAQESESADCVTNYLSRGRSVVGGFVYGIPFESVAGAPYAENELNSKPQTIGVASNAYEGFIGDIVLGTAVPGAVPSNPTMAKALWPPAAESANGPSFGSESKASYGPFAHAVSKAAPRKVTNAAMAFGDPATPFGPSRASQVSEFDGKAVKGTDTAVGYDLRLGPVTIDKMVSVLEYSSDGTDEGTTANWRLTFSGVGDDQTKVYTISREGFAPQGGDANGAEQIQQFNEGADQFGDALEQAGIGEGRVTIAPGEIEVRQGYVRFIGAALELRGFPAARRNSIGHQGGFVFGYHNRLVEVKRGGCFADVNKRVVSDIPQPEDKSINAGPVTIPDPTPPGYGGPQSTTPVPPVAPVPVAMDASPAPEVVHQAPLPVGVTPSPPADRRVSRPWF